MRTALVVFTAALVGLVVLGRVWPGRTRTRAQHAARVRRLAGLRFLLDVLVGAARLTWFAARALAPRRVR